MMWWKKRCMKVGNYIGFLSLQVCVYMGVGVQVYMGVSVSVYGCVYVYVCVYMGVGVIICVCDTSTGVILFSHAVDTLSRPSQPSLSHKHNSSSYPTLSTPPHILSILSCFFVLLCFYSIGSCYEVSMSYVDRKHFMLEIAIPKQVSQPVSQSASQPVPFVVVTPH